MFNYSKFYLFRFILNCVVAILIASLDRADELRVDQPDPTQVGAALPPAGALLGAPGYDQPQRCPADMLSGDLATAVFSVQQRTPESADWRNITFAKLPAVFRLGQFTSLSELKLSDIAARSPQASAIKFSELHWIASDQQTIAGFVRAVYPTAVAVGDVPGLAEFLRSSAVGRRQLPMDNAGLSRTSIASLEHINPRLMQQSIADLPWSTLPGLSDLTIAQLPHWQELTTNQIPGLADVSFTELFACLSADKG